MSKENKSFLTTQIKKHAIDLGFDVIQLMSPIVGRPEKFFLSLKIAGRVAAVGSIAFLALMQFGHKKFTNNK